MIGRDYVIGSGMNDRQRGDARLGLRVDLFGVELKWGDELGLVDDDGVREWGL